MSTASVCSVGRMLKGSFRHGVYHSSDYEDEKLVLQTITVDEQQNARDQHDHRKSPNAGVVAKKEMKRVSNILKSSNKRWKLKGRC